MYLFQHYPVFPPSWSVEQEVLAFGKAKEGQPPRPGDKQESPDRRCHMPMREDRVSGMRPSTLYVIRLPSVATFSGIFTKNHQG